MTIKRINEHDADAQHNAQVQERVNKICDLAYELHDLMVPGMTIELKLPTKQEIIIPNKKPEIKTLYLTRPNITLKIAPK